MGRVLIFILCQFILYIACDLTDPGPEGYATRRVSEIFVINSDGSNDKYLSDGSSPLFSSDSKQIIFVEDHSIWTINLDGSGKYPLTNKFRTLWNILINYPSNRILFSTQGFSGNSGDLFIVNADGNELRNLTNTNFVHEFSPSFSSDGSNILFEQWDGLYMMDLQGMKSLIFAVNDGTVSQAQFSASGKKIIYLRHPSKHIQIIDILTGEIDTTIAATNEHFAVCPSRDEILFNYKSLLAMNLLTYRTVKIADYNFMPVYSPDGNKIIYIDLHGNLVMINSDGSDSYVCKGPFPRDKYYRYESYAVSPDNSKIVYNKVYEEEIR